MYSHTCHTLIQWSNRVIYELTINRELCTCALHTA